MLIPTGHIAAQPADENVQAASAPEPVTLDSIIAGLDADSFAERERASHQLATARWITLGDIEQRLDEGGLSPEQRARLRNAGLERFASTPRAGLGVRFGVGGSAGGVAISQVLDEFPAAGHLQAGDVIVAIDGQPVRTTQEMSSLILSHSPGQILRLVIDRRVVRAANLLSSDQNPFGSERMTIDVPLGRFEDLDAGIRLQPDRLMNAYRAYRARRGPAGSRDSLPIVGAGITPLDWLHAEGYDHTTMSVPTGEFEPFMLWRTIGFAGQPESWVGDVELQRGDPNAKTRRVMAGLRARGMPDPTREALSGYRSLLLRAVEIERILAEPNARERLGDARVERLEAEHEEMMDGLEEFAAELGDADLPTISLPPMRSPGG